MHPRDVRAAQGLGDGLPEPARGITVTDRELTIQYRWKPANAWAEWRSDPLADAIGVVNEAEIT